MKYEWQCFPDNFLTLSRLDNIDFEIKYDIYSIIYSLANHSRLLQYSLNRLSSVLNVNTDLAQICKNIKSLDRKHKNTYWAQRKQLSNLTKTILKLFEYASDKLDTCMVKYFTKYIIRTENFFYNESLPLWNKSFSKTFNKKVKKQKHNNDRQLFIAMSRIAAQISQHQNNRINNMVCVSVNIFEYYMHAFCVCVVFLKISKIFLN